MSNKPDVMLKLSLKKIFKYDDFKSELQAKATAAIHEGTHDVYVSLPTGAGKSLCFQLPAALKENSVALVISPLLALVKNQVDFLNSKGVKAHSMNSKTSAKERKAILEDLNSKNPKTKLLYVTPEMCAESHFKELVMKLNKAKKISYLVIDEAHCLSEWGHDFRKSYRKLGEFRSKCLGVPLVALTATAASAVVEDIYQTLNIEKAKKFCAPVFRKNLFYDVQFIDPLDEPIEHLKKFIINALALSDDKLLPKNQKNCGIIYCRKRESTDLLAESLSRAGIPTLAYHSGCTNRESVQDKWTSGEVPVIAATCSFGMGVDKGSVRFVVHWTVPQSIAAYYQESGRAGRDGKPAYCRVYFSSDECRVRSFLMRNPEKGQTEAVAQQKFKNFEKVISYCLEPRCRHSILSKFFGDPAPPCTNRCDFCKDEKSTILKLEEFEQYKSQPERGQIIHDSIALSKFDTFDDESGGVSREQLIAAEKREAKALLEHQFLLRRGEKNTSDQIRQQNMKDAKNSKVRSAESTDRKVKGLTVQVREHCFDLLEEALIENYRLFGDDLKGQIIESDIIDIARELEYMTLSKTKLANKYKLDMKNVISAVRAATNNKIIYEYFKTYMPNAAFTTVKQYGEFVTFKLRETSSESTAVEIKDSEKETKTVEKRKQLQVEGSRRSINSTKKVNSSEKNSLHKYLVKKHVEEKVKNDFHETEKLTIDKSISKTNDKLSIECDAVSSVVALNKDLSGKRASTEDSDNFEGNHPNKRRKNNSSTSALVTSEHTMKQSTKSEVKKFVPRIPTTRTLSFQTTDVLKAYLMKDYPSKRLPNKDVFRQTCREIHKLIMVKGITVDEEIHKFAEAYLCQKRK